MSWATDADVKMGIAAALKRADPADLPAYLDHQIARATRKAQGQIRGILTDARRFTEQQLLAWSRLEEFHYDQSLFNSEVYLREAYKDVAGELLKLKDRTADLMTVVLGVEPEGDPLGLPGVGAGHGGVLVWRQAYDEAEARWRRGGGYGPGWGPYWTYGY